MFENDVRPARAAYGLYSGQTRGEEFLRNVGWYNSAGERLGWGDLSRDDIRRLMSELPANQYFVILGEVDAYWNFMRRATAERTAGLDIEAPGIEYLIEFARYAVTKGHFNGINRHGVVDVSCIKAGLVHEYISPEQLRALLKK
jgi:hypothetical protein